jgi:hypothetical protein
MTAFDVLPYIGISRVIMRSFLIGLPQESVERKVMRTQDPNGYLQEWNMLRIRPQKMEYGPARATPPSIFRVTSEHNPVWYDTRKVLRRIMLRWKMLRKKFH